MAGVTERRLGTQGLGPGLEYYIRKPDPNQPVRPVVPGTNPQPND
jgi:hypothetical protein